MKHGEVYYVRIPAYALNGSVVFSGFVGLAIIEHGLDGVVRLLSFKFGLGIQSILAHDDFTFSMVEFCGPPISFPG